jgi:N-methylhydantoinase B
MGYTANEGADPITRELTRNALDALVDEMALTLVRTAYSSNLKNSLDLSAAVCDAGGRLIAQGLTLPLHLGSVPEYMRAVRARFGDEMRPGDTYITNDPYEGGSHLPDLYLCRPIFREGVLAAFLVCIAHHTDIGGRTPGGNGCDATELYQEGLRVPLVRLYDRDVPNETVFEFIARNVRIPRQVLGDLRAQLAALHTGERGLRALFERYDAATLGACCEALPVEGETLTVDFAGTSPQVRGGINCPLSFSQSAVYACVRGLMPAGLPNNEGYFRPIQVRIPEGSILNPRPPAPVAARGLTGFRVANAVFGALAQVAPDRVPAAEIGGDTGVSFGGYLPPARTPFVFLEFLYGSWGGRPDRDGIDGVASAVVNFSNNPVEVLESELPLRVEQYGYVPDTGGPGKFRGGLSLVRDFRLLADEATLQIRADRMRHRPYGLHGGQPGAPSQNVLNPEAEASVLSPKPTLTIRRGDVFRHVAAGAGGWGDPRERDVDRVLEDVREGKVTLSHARDAYGVVIDPETLTVDRAATPVRREGWRERQEDKKTGRQGDREREAG